MVIRHSGRAVLAFTIMALSVSANGEGQEATASESSPHAVRTTKFTVGDVDKNTAFYVEMLGMTEMNRYVAEGRLVEPLMGFGDAGQRIGLLSYTEKEGLEKSPYPVTVIYAGEFDELVARFETAQYPLMLLPASDTGGVRIGIASDPSGNAIEIIDRPGAPGVAGSRLIVNDRQKAEDFFVRIFGSGVKPGQRFETEAFDEVLMDFGESMFVALFEPKGVAPLPKSTHPVVAIYTTELDAVIERVKAEGFGYTEFRPGRVFMVNDPSGNVVEIVRQQD
jgi:catechol 2,3-dioxygenase-like lactoylglutathione lyase family enzyme